MVHLSSISSVGSSGMENGSYPESEGNAKVNTPPYGEASSRSICGVIRIIFGPSEISKTIECDGFLLPLVQLSQ